MECNLIKLDNMSVECNLIKLDNRSVECNLIKLDNRSLECNLINLTSVRIPRLSFFFSKVKYSNIYIYLFQFNMNSLCSFFPGFFFSFFLFFFFFSFI